MMMRAQTNIQTAVNRPFWGRLGSFIRGQSLAGGVRDRYCTPPYATHRVTKENLLIIRVTIGSGRHFLSLPSARPHPAPNDVGMFYVHADPPKSLPPTPVRVSRRSQLTAALRQHARPIVIEDQELASPFVRLLHARQLRPWGLGEFVANTMSCGIDQSYGANVEAHWYVGRYVLPENVQKVILKPKPYGAGRLPRHLQA